MGFCEGSRGLEYETVLSNSNFDIINRAEEFRSENTRPYDELGYRGDNFDNVVVSWVDEGSLPVTMLCNTDFSEDVEVAKDANISSAVIDKALSGYEGSANKHLMMDRAPEEDKNKVISDGVEEFSPSRAVKVVSDHIECVEICQRFEKYEQEMIGFLGEAGEYSLRTEAREFFNEVDLKQNVDSIDSDQFESNVVECFKDTVDSSHYDVIDQATESIQTDLMPVYADSMRKYAFKNR